MASNPGADDPARPARVDDLLELLDETPDVARAEERIELFDALADDQPDDLRRPLAARLLKLAKVHRDAGRFDDALWFAHEGYEVFREIAERDEDGVDAQHEYAVALFAVADLLEDAGQLDDAVRMAAACVRTFDLLASELAPGRFKPWLLRAMLLHEGILEKLDELGGAMHMLEQGLSLSLQLARDEVADAGRDIYETAYRYSQLCLRLKRPTDDERFDRVLARLIAAGLLDIEDLEKIPLDETEGDAGTDEPEAC